MKGRLAHHVVPLCLVVLFLLGCDNRSGGQVPAARHCPSSPVAGPQARTRSAGWASFWATSSFPSFWEGALLAVQISALAMVGGVFLGLGLALMRLSRSRADPGSAWVYIWFMRGTPLLLQLVFLYDALPGDRHQARHLHDRGDRLRPQRGGVQRRDHSRRHPVGQPQPDGRGRLARHGAVADAAPHHPAAGHARHPAAASANDTISMLKGTSIASVIFVNELTFRASRSSPRTSSSSRSSPRPA